MDSEKHICAAAGRCGSCGGLTIPYERQLSEKQERVGKLLGPFCSVEPILGMEDPRHYRNKVHRVVGRDRKGQLVLGSYEAGSHRLVPVSECLLEDEACQRILPTLEKLIRSFRMTIYDERTRTGFLRHLLLRRGYTTGEILVVLVGTALNFPGKNNFVRALRAAHPEITTIVLNLNDKDTDMVLGERENVLWGTGYIRDVLCGLTFRLSSRSFFQINPVQTGLLYRTAIELAGLTEHETVIDAYCGIGTIGLIASRNAGKVIGFELNPAAVADARLNATENGIRNAVFTCGDAGKCIRGMAAEGKRADVIFMDPPRSGSTEVFMESAVRLDPSRIVYVSCGPDTLARDLKWFAAHGYHAARIKPVDMFPFTPHVETVVLLSKSEIDSKKNPGGI